MTRTLPAILALSLLLAVAAAGRTRESPQYNSGLEKGKERGREACPLGEAAAPDAFVACGGERRDADERGPDPDFLDGCVVGFARALRECDPESPRRKSSDRVVPGKAPSKRPASPDASPGTSPAR